MIHLPMNATPETIADILMNAGYEVVACAKAEPAVLARKVGHGSDGLSDATDERAAVPDITEERVVWHFEDRWPVAG